MITKDKNMYLLTYDHGGYILWGPYFKERIASAVEWLKKYPKFKIGLDNEAFAYDKYAQDDPEVIVQINDILKKFKSRFAIGSSTYGQPLSVFINEESNVRQITYAIRTNLHYFNETPSVFAISEHALHSQIPQLIKQAGYRAAVMRTHFMMYGYNPTYPDAYGEWFGDDGTSLPTVPTYDGEGAEFAVTTMDNWILTRWPEQTAMSLEDFGEKFKNVEPLLASRYDDIILRCEALTAYVETKPAYQWITLEEIPKLFGKPVAEFRPNANEFKVRMPWGYCGNRIFNDCREAELQVALAERTNAAAFLLGGASLQDDLENAWKNLLISQHHDIQICGLLKDESAYIPVSLALSKKVLHQSIKYIASKFTTKTTQSLVVFNPLSFASVQTVETEIAVPRGEGFEGLSVKLGEKQIPCSVCVLDAKGSKITRATVRFQAELEGLTAHCYSIEETVSSMKTDVSYCEKAGIITACGYTIKLDESGICKIEKDGSCYVNSETGTLFTGIIDGKPCTSKGIWTVSCKHNEVVAQQFGTIGGIGYQFKMVVRDGRIDCNVAFQHNGEIIGSKIETAEFKKNTNGFIHEDKLRFILHTVLTDQTFGVRDLPFLIEKTEDNYIQGNYWMALTDGKLGIAYLNKGAMCGVKEGQNFSLPFAYSNEYVWGTRSLYGEYTHAFSILPFAFDVAKAEVHKKALAYEFPFVTTQIKNLQKGTFDSKINLIKTVTNDAVVLSGLYPENGEVIARYYEYGGKPSELRLESNFAEVTSEVTIMGEDCGKPQDSYHFRQHEIKSFKLTKRCFDADN